MFAKRLKPTRVRGQRGASSNKERLMRKRQHDAYRCPTCGDQIRKIITEDHEGHVHSYVWQCRGCWKEFGPEWTEVPNQTSETATILVGLEPWTTGTAQDSVLDMTLRTVAPQVQSNWRSISVRVIPAVLIAATSIVLVLDQLLQRSVRATQATLI